jgi:hypothetical protein
MEKYPTPRGYGPVDRLQGPFPKAFRNKAIRLERAANKKGKEWPHGPLPELRSGYHQPVRINLAKAGAGLLAGCSFVIVLVETIFLIWIIPQSGE